MQRFSGLQLKSISINTGVQFLIRLSTSIPTLAATLLIAYFAGYETLGSFTKIVAFVSIFYLIVDFGINSIFLKNHFDDTKKYLGNLILLRLLFSLLLLPIIALLAFLLPENKLAGTGFSSIEKSGIILYSLTIIFVGLNLSLQAFLQRKLAYYLSLLPTILSSITLLAMIFLAVSQKNLSLLLLSYVVSGAVLVVSLFVVLRFKYKLSLRQTSNFTKFSKGLLIASLPLGTMLFFNLLYAKADTLILSVYRPTFDVGVYGISYRFFEFLLAFPAFLANSIYPILLKESKNPKTYLPMFKKYQKLFLFISLGVTVIAFIATPLITIFKSEFIKSVGPLQILVLSLPFFFMTSLLQWHFVIRGKMKFLVPLYAGGLFLNVILNIIFIPIYSYYAAAITTGLCEGIVFIILLWYFWKSKLA